MTEEDTIKDVSAEVAPVAAPTGALDAVANTATATSEDIDAAAEFAALLQELREIKDDPETEIQHIDPETYAAMTKGGQL